MRNSLSCNVSVRHFGVWRVAVWLLALLSVASLAAWVVSGLDFWSTGAMVAAAVAALAVLWLAASLARVSPATLRLQEGRWTFAQDLPPGAEMTEVTQVDVAIDLGSFLLLRSARCLFGRCRSRAGCRAAAWPRARLACASLRVYSTRPAPLAPAWGPRQHLNERPDAVRPVARVKRRVKAFEMRSSTSPHRRLSAGLCGTST